MKIKDCMAKNVITINASTGIKRIYDIFKEHGIGILPVVDKEKKLLGIVTRRLLMNVFLPEYVDILDGLLFAINDLGALEEEFDQAPALELFLAEDLMIKDVVYIEQDASLIKAAMLMQKYKIHNLPVIKNEKIVGLITLSDICEALFGGQEQ